MKNVKTNGTWNNSTSAHACTAHTLFLPSQIIQQYTIKHKGSTGTQKIYVPPVYHSCFGTHTCSLLQSQTTSCNNEEYHVWRTQHCLINKVNIHLQQVAKCKTTYSMHHHNAFYISIFKTFQKFWLVIYLQVWVFSMTLFSVKADPSTWKLTIEQYTTFIK